MKKYLSLLTLILVVFSFNAQTTYTVDNTTDSGADYSNLQTAIDEANPGDTIQVHSSPTSYGNISIPKTIYIIGTGHNPAANNDLEVATITTIILKSNCANTTINGVEFSTLNVGTPIIDITDITIRNCKITSTLTGSNNINVQDWLLEGNLFINAYVNPSNGYNWIIRNNIFQTNSYSFYNFNSSITLTNNLIVMYSNLTFSSCELPTVTNNIFYATGGATAIEMSSSTLSASNNLTFAGNGALLGSLTGTDNLNNVDPEFVDANDGTIGGYYTSDYHADTGSPLENAGTDGNDIGLYGGNFGYHQDGKPSDFPYMVSLGIQNASVEAGELLNVIFSAQKNQ